jgi:hypothetical protein
MEHEESSWCWCRPKEVDVGDFIIVKHRNLPEGVLAGRLLYGGPEEESNGDAAVWLHEYP